MNEPLVSIIVPVYRVEPYLDRCIESLLAQTYHNLEIFLVNDGSPDGCGGICRAAAEADRRIVYLEKENSGVSDSRNRAMDLAVGKYLQFADGDDWLDPEATATFVRAAEVTGSDLVVSHFYRVDKGRQADRGHIKTEGVFTRQEFAEHMMKAPGNYYYGVLWNKFYRRSVVEANAIRCRKEMTWCEDFVFNLEYLEHARLVTTVSRPLYYYRKREDSAVGTGTTLRRVIETKRQTFAAYKELYQSLELYEEQKARVYSYLLAPAVDGSAFTVPQTRKRRLESWSNGEKTD